MFACVNHLITSLACVETLVTCAGCSSAVPSSLCGSLTVELQLHNHIVIVTLEYEAFSKLKFAVVTPRLFNVEQLCSLVIRSLSGSHTICMMSHLTHRIKVRAVGTTLTSAFAWRWTALQRRDQPRIDSADLAPPWLACSRLSSCEQPDDILRRTLSRHRMLASRRGLCIECVTIVAVGILKAVRSLL